MRHTLLVLLVGMVVGVPAYAHHSFAAHYFEEQSVTISGQIVEFQYRNPHAWVFVEALDENGQMQRFGAEWGGTRRLSQRGITSDTLQAGDHVVVTGAPGRNPEEHVLHLKSIERPADSWTWSGRGRRGRLGRQALTVELPDSGNDEVGVNEQGVLGVGDPVPIIVVAEPPVRVAGALEIVTVNLNKAADAE